MKGCPTAPTQQLNEFLSFERTQLDFVSKALGGVSRTCVFIVLLMEILMSVKCG